MSTGLIIAIVVVVLILVALLFLLPRMRAKTQERKARRELESRRDQVATEHRETASSRASEAERAEQAAQRARAQRAEADHHEAQAKMHDRGLADDQLVEDHERERFAGVSGDNGTTEADRADAERRPVAEEGRTNTEYEQGREDERHAEHGDRAPRR